MRVIFDSNIWISFLLGFQKDFMRSVLNDSRIEVFVCPQLIAEIKAVASRPKIRSRLSENDLDKLFDIMLAYCHQSNITAQAVSNIRDKKDLYLLSFAESINSVYIVSGDKDLTDLQQHKTTHIVDLATFKQIRH